MVGNVLFDGFLFFPNFFQDFYTRFSRCFPRLFEAFSRRDQPRSRIPHNAVFRFAGCGPLSPLVVRRSCGPWGRGDFSSRGGHDVHGEPVTPRRAVIRVREGREGVFKRRPIGVRENMTCENLIRRRPLGTVQSIMDPVLPRPVVEPDAASVGMWPPRPHARQFLQETASPRSADPEGRFFRRQGKRMHEARRGSGRKPGAFHARGKEIEITGLRGRAPLWRVSGGRPPCPGHRDATRRTSLSHALEPPADRSIRTNRQ